MIKYNDKDTNAKCSKLYLFFFFLSFLGAACNKIPGFTQFHFMVSSPLLSQPTEQVVDCI